MRVASFNFGESRLLAEIYVAVLEEADVTVRRQLDLGPRELVLPALLQGKVDVVPEYLGSASAALAASGSAGLRLLAPAAAENQNAIVVTRATAERLQLTTISSLLPHAPELVLGGPPECAIRSLCALGLEDTYGLRFRELLPFSTTDRTRRALEDGVVDVAVMFTTDGHLATEELVVLTDDRHLQPPENVVALVRTDVVERHPRLVAALEAVAAHLTTAALRSMNWRVEVGLRDARFEARAWLMRRGLIERPPAAPVRPR